jgi:hypothetical protein
MAYNIVDLIYKLIRIEEKVAGLYKGVRDNRNVPVTLQILARALYKEEERHIKYFQHLQEELKGVYLSDFDVGVYDKVSSLVDSFRNTIIYPEVVKTADLINFSLDFESKYLAVLIDIRGRMVKSEKDLDTEKYKYISSFIKEKKGHINNIEHLKY